MWETQTEITLKEFELKCKKCNSNFINVKCQVYLDQGYYPTHYRKVITCNSCGKEEMV